MHTSFLTPFIALALVACSTPIQAADLPRPLADLPPAKPGELRTAVFAMGCFWCSEAVFEQLEGVTEVVSGYAGGTADTATYDQVSAHKTEHAEAIQITYDDRITYAQLLQVLFTVHDPTTLDRQGPDSGHQYRSAIFYRSEEERRVAEAYLKQLEAAKIFGAPIVTTLEKLAVPGRDEPGRPPPLADGSLRAPLARLPAFYPAERYHQDFVARNPDHPYVRAHSVPKLQKLVSKFGALLKKK